jgi:hypothetical protein
MLNRKLLLVPLVGFVAILVVRFGVLGDQIIAQGVMGTAHLTFTFFGSEELSHTSYDPKPGLDIEIHLAQGGALVAQTQTDSKGQYRIPLPPGSYVMEIHGSEIYGPADNSVDANTPIPFTVGIAKYTRLDLEGFDCL